MKEISGNGMPNIIAQAIAEMKIDQGDSFSLDRIDLCNSALPIFCSISGWDLKSLKIRPEVSANE